MRGVVGKRDDDDHDERQPLGAHSIIENLEFFKRSVISRPR